MARTTPTASPPSPPPPSLASRCLALLVLALPLVLAAATSAGGALETLDFQEQCAQRCPFQVSLSTSYVFKKAIRNKTEEGDFDIGCGNECKIEQNGTQDPLPPKEFYCIMGCNDALNRYFQKLKEEK
ncbi:Tyrosine-protein kinase receptor [Gryllus bimaculatus]|nr:Tyrosine-protein kinase receptor [Gryllus bimaculatus]